MTRVLKISSLRAQPATTTNVAVNATYPRQWAWDKIHLKEAWKDIAEKKCKQRPIIVAIVDWGIQADHEAFRPGLVMDGVNILSNSRSNVTDDDGHGTMLAGTIAGILTNIPDGGQADRSVQLLPIKFIDAHNPPMAKNAAKAITYAVDAGAKIINASWDVGLDSRELREALARAAIRKVLVVIAAGNGGSNNNDYPTIPASLQRADITLCDRKVRLDNMITVMASDAEDDKPGFSNYGDDVDIAAPGEDIVSPSPYDDRLPAHLVRSPDNRYRKYRGTSAAAAHVTGAAALLLSINPDLSAQQLRQCLIDSAEPIPALEPYCPGGRRLHLQSAVDSLLHPGLGPDPLVRPRAVVRSRLRWVREPAPAGSATAA